MPEIKLQKRAVYAVDVYHALLEVGWKIKPTLRFVQGLPKTDVAPVRHGEWLDMQEDDLTEGMWRCSACGEDRYFYEGHPSEYQFKFCPGCGAMMDGGTDNAE